MSLEKYLDELGDKEQPIRHAGLGILSGLSEQEMPVFRKAWETYEVPRKIGVLTKLVDIADDNVDMDFTSIFRACLKDSHELVREKALMGLWECDDRSLIMPLISLLKDDPSEAVRAASAMVLGKFASLAEDGKVLAKDGQRIRDALLEVIENASESSEVKRRAIEAVAPFNTPRIHKIIDDAYRSNDQKVKQSSLYAMGKSCDPAWLPVIVKELGSDNPAMRYEAANACAELGEEAAVPHLIELLKDDDPQIQVAAISAMGAIGGSLSKRALQRCLKLEDEPLREAAEEALVNMGVMETPLSFRLDV